MNDHRSKKLAEVMCRRAQTVTEEGKSSAGLLLSKKFSDYESGLLIYVFIFSIIIYHILTWSM